MEGDTQAQMSDASLVASNSTPSTMLAIWFNLLQKSDTTIREYPLNDNKTQGIYRISLMKHLLD